MGAACAIAVPDRYEFGRVATKFQKLVVSGTFHLRNVFCCR
jgi:hypothetical protein